MQQKGKAIEEWSLAYSLLKYYVDYGFKFYYKTTYLGTENIPKDKPVIFAPNHQNALMDALAILSTQTWQPVFLARADIFQKPLINKILTFLKIMPVFRIRDGFENLHKNDATFNKTIAVLKNGNGLVILPEGNHAEHKRLRPLKKGIARIALQAESSSPQGMDIQIVPVGIDYSDYKDVKSRLLVRYGKPIPVKSFLSTYNQNPARAYKGLLDELSKRLRDEMIHIGDEKYYSAYTSLLSLYTKEYLSGQGIKCNHNHRFEAQKKIIASIDQLKADDENKFQLLISDALEYNMLLNRRGLSAELFPMKKADKFYYTLLIIVLLALSPLHLYAFINHLIPLATAKLLGKKFKDPQFISSVRFVAGLVALPLSYITQIILVAIFTTGVYPTLIYAVTLPLAFYLFFIYKKWFEKFWAWSVELKFKLFSPRRMVRMNQLRNELIEQLNMQMGRND